MPEPGGPRPRDAKPPPGGLSLPPASALVEYRFFDPYDFATVSFGATHLLAVVLTPDGPPRLVDLGEAAPIADLQRSMVGADRTGASFDAAAGLLHERLIAPLLPHLGTAETLYIAPDGALSALPFEALSDGCGKRLVERFQMHMLQTGRDLVARDRLALGKGIVTIGGVDFGPMPESAAPAMPEGAELEGLLAEVAGPIAAVYGDGAYDAFDIHAAVLARAARPVIPPRKGTAIRPPPRLKDPPPTRGAVAARIAEIGRKALKQETGYHRRSLAETGVYRYKTLIGPGLKARTLDNQKAEAAIGVRCVNRFTALGMPRSLRIA